MIPKIITCKNCNADIKINTYRKKVLCKCCNSEFEFEGFDYIKLDKSSSKYTGIKYEMDCPACRSKHMFLFTKTWRCEDCGYHISDQEKQYGVLWFCDNCDAYMNVQEGFTTKNDIWECTECGFTNGTTDDDIL